jgi:quinol monooxygenase YgiN
VRDGRIAVFGTIATCRVKPGMEDGFLQAIEEWGQSRGSEIEGPLRVYVARSVQDPNVLLNIVLFDSREHYEANAADPEQDKWYQRMVANLEAPPEWDDHEVLLAYEFVPPEG